MRIQSLKRITKTTKSNNKKQINKMNPDAYSNNAIRYKTMKRITEQIN